MWVTFNEAQNPTILMPSWPLSCLLYIQYYNVITVIHIDGIISTIFTVNMFIAIIILNIITIIINNVVIIIRIIIIIGYIITFLFVIVKNDTRDYLN